MCDEMDLKSGCFFSTQTGKLVGVESENVKGFGVRDACRKFVEVMAFDAEGSIVDDIIEDDIDSDQEGETVIHILLVLLH